MAPFEGALEAHGPQLFIEGAWVERGGGVFAIHDPADGSPVGATSLASSAGVDRAVRLAARASPTWAATHADERARIVLDDADVKEAAVAAARRSFSNMGQICIAVNRILVA